MKFDLLILQKALDCLAESYLIFTDELLDLQLLDEIKCYVVFCKAYIAGAWQLRGKCWSAF